MRNLPFNLYLVILVGTVVCTRGLSLTEKNAPSREVVGNATQQLEVDLKSSAQKQLQPSVADGTNKEAKGQEQDASNDITKQKDVSPDPANNSTSSAEGVLGDMIQRNWDALVRSIYVFGALSVLGFVYLGFRTWRLRRRRGGGNRRTGSRRYAPLSSNSRGGLNNQEMEPLGHPQDEDDDEDTVFDTSAHPSSRM